MFSIFRRIIFIVSTLVFILSASAYAQTWNPNLGWKDSYAVGGKCYCDSNGYDHNLDSKFAETPIGSQNVVDICEAIERVLGYGALEGRIPYNDIQCGNGPPNDAADEIGCPGRVDIGPEGCDQIGPKWDLESVYINNPDPRPDNSLDRSKWILSASHNNDQVGRMIDKSVSTRWSSGTPQSPAQYIIIDLTERLNFNRIELDSSGSVNDYPRGYSIFVSFDGINWGSPITTGMGEGRITVINLSAQAARYIRIAQTGSDVDFWWSVHELKIFDGLNTNPIAPPTSTKHLSPIINLLLSVSRSG